MITLSDGDNNNNNSTTYSGSQFLSTEISKLTPFNPSSSSPVSQFTMAVIPLHSPSLGLFVTDHDLSPVLQIITWILLAVTTLMLVFRLLTRFVLKGHRKVGWEEGFIVAAFVGGLEIHDDDEHS